MVKLAGVQKMLTTPKPTGPEIDANGKMVKQAWGGKTLKPAAPKTARIINWHSRQLRKNGKIGKMIKPEKTQTFGKNVITRRPANRRGGKIVKC